MRSFLNISACFSLQQTPTSRHPHPMFSSALFLLSFYVTEALRNSLPSFLWFSPLHLEQHPMDYRSLQLVFALRRRLGSTKGQYMPACSSLTGLIKLCSPTKIDSDPTEVKETGPKSEAWRTAANWKDPIETPWKVVTGSNSENTIPRMHWEHDVPTVRCRVVWQLAVTMHPQTGRGKKILCKYCQSLDLGRVSGERRVPELCLL